MKMARESSPSLWENQFKDILMSVVEKMKDPDVCAIEMCLDPLLCSGLEHRLILTRILTF